MHIKTYLDQDPTKQEQAPPIPESEEPWHPFATRLDFQFAELAVEARLNESHTRRFIDHIQEAAGRNPDSEFTFQSMKEYEEAWDKASKLATLVSNSI